MKTKTFVKKLLCLVMVSVMLLGASVSASAVRFETEDIALTDNDTEIENIGTIDSDIEIGDIEPIEEFVYLEGDILEGQIADVPDYGDANMLAANNTQKAEEEMTINLLGLGYESNSSFKNLFTKNELLLSDDPTNYYFGMQGGCTDGEYNYFAFIVRNALQEHMDTRIVCYKIDEPESSRILYWTTGLKSKLQHINDMTYNSITGEIVIACCKGGYYQQLYTINANEFRFTPSDDQQNQTKIFQDAVNLNLVRHNVSCMVTSIGFNETRNQYVVGLSKQTNYMAILDSDFNLIKKVGYEPQDRDTDWAGQGLHCDNKYIYLTQFDLIEGTGRQITDSYESRIKIFDWNGDHKRTIRFEVDKNATEENLDPGEPSKNERYCEVENMFVVDNRVYLGFNCLYDKEYREFTYVDITNYTYYIQYCPDENVGNYYEKIGENDYIAKDNDNVKSVMIKGLKTHLYRSRITKSGKEFIGWTAYRANVNKWLYKSPNATDESTNGWYVEGQQPEGYVKYVYNDTQNVTNTGLGGELVLMCAQWKDVSTFTVKFFSNGGTGTMDDLIVTHGISKQLRPNSFTKNGRTFKGWNAYWPEKNKWYYRSKDGLTRDWFVEGCEPTGYRKYKYAYDQSVAQTVHAGSNVYMYAVWDEFTVYYNANGVEVEAEGIIDARTLLHEGTGSENKTQNYDTNKFYTYKNSFGVTIRPYEKYNLEGYYQYRIEDDTWLCADEAGEAIGWYTQKQITDNGYKKFVRLPSSNIKSTVPIGERLVLYAIWSKN